MEDPKTICKKYGLNNYQAQKGAEVMLTKIVEDMSNILLTASPIPVHVRVAEYFNIKIG